MSVMTTTAVLLNMKFCPLMGDSVTEEFMALPYLDKKTTVLYLHNGGHMTRIEDPYHLPRGQLVAEFDSKR